MRRASAWSGARAGLVVVTASAVTMAGCGADEPSTNGGGTGAGGGAAEACDPACTAQQACIDLVCQPMSVLAVGVEAFAAAPGAAPSTYRIMGRAWHWTADGGPGYFVAGEDGDCRVADIYNTLEAPESFVPDVGTITVTSPTIGNEELPPFNVSGFTTVDVPLVPSGEEIAVTVGGGLDFPPFSATVAMAEAPAAVGVGTVERGAPMEVTWTPTPDDDDTIAVHVALFENGASDPRIMVYCETSDSGSLTISGSLTALFENQTASEAVVTVNRWRRQVGEPTERAYVVQAQKFAQFYIDTGYVP